MAGDTILVLNAGSSSVKFSLFRADAEVPLLRQTKCAGRTGGGDDRDFAERVFAIEFRKHDIAHQLEHAGLAMEAYLESEGKTQEEFDSELADAARKAVKSQLLLDAVADAERSASATRSSPPRSSGGLRTPGWPRRSSPTGSSSPASCPS